MVLSSAKLRLVFAVTDIYAVEVMINCSVVERISPFPVMFPRDSFDSRRKPQSHH